MPVALFSLEMASVQLITRLISSERDSHQRNYVQIRKTRMGTIEYQSEEFRKSTVVY
jgi:replicative DNA helicase